MVIKVNGWKGSNQTTTESKLPRTGPRESNHYKNQSHNQSKTNEALRCSIIRAACIPQIHLKKAKWKSLALVTCQDIHLSTRFSNENKGERERESTRFQRNRSRERERDRSSTRFVRNLERESPQSCSGGEREDEA
ncbi:hypothetical protein RHGRI_029402 [Rhododendron griersonianum]|uniref:Uncharacterized protein n=1 Tax=Rhododendron griersonianum TaxID=479676 RepID=A0AAV6IK25_9ERIC|nr:hypothetical protein RHGRI_029402 [Rhododendron griersonianum]